MGKKRDFPPTNDKPASLYAGEDVALVWHHGGHVSNQASSHGGVTRKLLQVEKRLLPRAKPSKEENPGG